MARGTSGLFLGAVFALIAKVAGAEGACLPGTEVGRLVSMIGDVHINGVPPVGELPFVPMCAGDLITVGTRSRAGIYLLDADTPVRLDQDTIARIEAASTPDSGLFDLTRGAIYFLSQVRRTLTIRTPYVNAGIEGTEVYLRVREAAAELIVLEGRVALAPGAATTAPFAPETVATGERADVAATGAVERATLPSPGGRFGALREVAVGALSWTLFYPDVLTEADAAQFPRIAQASRLLAAGQVADAEAVLAAVPATGTEAGLAAALRAIIAVGRKDAGLAGRLADRAVALAPASPVPQLALSYARQLALDLDGAFAAAETAAQLAPEGPLPQARLAEIHLMRGETRQARRAADEAVRLGGGPLAQMVLGFAELAALRGARAAAAFRQALQDESWNPLALLGLGLAEIKQGDLDDGTTQIENAVTHDPGSSLLRSYLGEAFFEQLQDLASGTQYQIAKTLDPVDPTPWMLDAIRKQAGNRPVEALRDLERSITLNANRAPFRSRLLLDQDAATRGAALGRIYDDLDFEQLGRVEAAKSLALDPANVAAHRFLADLYLGEERREFARASEVLKTQLLAPPNTNPLPVRLAETRLRLSGVEALFPVGFNEYSSLFERDRVRAVVTGVGGTQSTYGDEVVVSGLSGPVALSASQLFTSSDGFRRNADGKNRLQGVFGKIALNESTNIQAEFRRRRSDEGDIVLNYDPEDYFKEDGLRLDRNQDTAQLGATVKLSPSSSLLATGFYSDRGEKQRFSGFKNVFDEEGYQGELQHILVWPSVNMVTGLSTYKFNAHNEPPAFTDSDGTLVEPPAEDFDSQDRTLYNYVGTDPTDDLHLTLGLAFDQYRRGEVNLNKVLPKFGIIWSPTPIVTVRAAAFRALKRALVVEQTLEPTEISGFTQMFDDFNGTVSERFGIGLDIRTSSSTYVGLEASYRNVSLPIDEFTDDHTVEDHNEQQLSAYIYWTINNQMALTGDLAYDRLEGGKTKTSFLPKQADTTSLSLGWVYYHPSGIYANLVGEMGYQNVQRQFAQERQFALEESIEGSNTFFVFDALLGYRLPKRRGSMAFEVNNLFNENFSYLDNSYRTGEFRTNSPYLPSRSILARLTLNF